MTRLVISMTIDDVEHYTPEQKASIIDSYPKYQREARARGVPQLGSGRIFPIEDEQIIVPHMPIPRHWPQINGIDFGWDHPFAAVNLAWDRETDCVYVCKCYRKREAVPAIHAAAMKPWGAWIPCAWPHDGMNTEKGSGEPLAPQYRSHGLAMLDERTSHEEGGNSVEAGLMDMLERMETGRFKVFAGLNDWFEEFRLYHRKDGKIIKLRDDLMDATRYGVMMLREARTAPSEYKKRSYGGGSAWSA
jgi:hypothetical protein